MTPRALVVSGSIPRILALAILIAAAPAALDPVSAQKLPTLGPREGLRVGDLAFDFTAQDLDGRPHRLRDLRGQRVVHLVFWATWCVPCVEEIPHLREVYERHRGEGLEILGVVVAMHQSRDGVRAFAEKNRIPYPILWDGDQKVMDRYRVDAIPQNFLIDRDGVIRYAGGGLPDRYDDLVRSMLAPAPAPRPAGK